jgi:uncharacterized protein (TIGR01777 family)
VLSDKGGILSPLTLPLKLYVGGRFGSGRQYMPWIHIDDEVGAIRFLIEHDEAQGPYNLSSPNPVTNAELYKVLGEVMHRPTWLPVPSWSLRLVLGDMASLLLSGQRAIPKRLEELGYQFRYLHLRAAAEDLLASGTNSRSAEGV